jgi:hypothetical protein
METKPMIKTRDEMKSTIVDEAYFGGGVGGGAAAGLDLGCGRQAHGRKNTKKSFKVACGIFKICQSFIFCFSR